MLTDKHTPNPAISVSSHLLGAHFLHTEEAYFAYFCKPWQSTTSFMLEHIPYQLLHQRSVGKPAVSSPLVVISLPCRGPAGTTERPCVQFFWLIAKREKYKPSSLSLQKIKFIKHLRQYVSGNYSLINTNLLT